ncbi:MAG: DUF805 domain-containing protein [Oscillospiraceae bacterium]
MNWYIKVIKSYVNFGGRARRKEYWTFALINVAIVTGLNIADAMMGFSIGNYGLFGSIYSLFIMLPSIAVCFRRLHDVNKSGWWLLAALVPVLGWLWIVFCLIQEGTQGTNKYGDDPKNENQI